MVLSEAPAGQQVSRQADPVLRPFLQAAGESEVRRHRERLLAEAEPIIQGIVRQRWRLPRRRSAGHETLEEQTADDVRADVLVRLIRSLDALREGSEPGAIASFRGFVATITYHACDDHLRRKYPGRASVKDRLYHLLSGRGGCTGFALWQTGDGERLAGFAAWRTEARSLRRSERCQRLLDAPERLAVTVFPREDVKRLNPADLVAGILNWLGGPLAFDDLVRVVAALWDIREPVREEAREEEEDAIGQLRDPREDVAHKVESRLYLEALWAEIRQLPPGQASALLLNLKDGEGKGVIDLLPIAGIAGPRQIAAALSLPAERLAGLWPDLPLEDTAIAALLGCTRQQVINLRSVARRRLERRMRLSEADAAA